MGLCIFIGKDCVTSKCICWTDINYKEIAYFVKCKPPKGSYEKLTQDEKNDFDRWNEWWKF